MTVSGTVTTNQGTAGAAAWKVDGSATTQPVSAAALPLPAGAAQDGADPASPAVANTGTGIRGWLATIAGLLKLGIQTQANSASVTMASDLANLEPAGAKITAASMPAGGTGLTGWLSAIWFAATAANQRTAYALEANGSAAAASATISGAARDAAASPTAYTRFTASILSTQAGTLQVWANPDGSVWILVDSVAVSANVPARLSVPVLGRYNQFRFVNGATAGTIQVLTALSTN